MWYKHDPADFLGGVVGLNPEQRGVYITIIDLIYLHDGSIAANWYWIAGQCGCDVRVIKRIVGELVSRGKLGLDAEGKVFNNRCTVELAVRKDRTAQATQAGRKGGLNRAAKYSQFKNIGLATAIANAVQKDKKERVTTSLLGAARNAGGKLDPKDLTPSPELATKINGGATHRHQPQTNHGPVFVPNTDPRFAYLEQSHLIVYGQGPKQDARGAWFPAELLDPSNPQTA
jgi:uncharacterized protein YdaU (DUF1376 family)